MINANNLATGGLKPDLTILMDLSPEEGFRRVNLTGRELDRMELEKISFHQRVRDGYLSLAKDEPERFLVVDGNEQENNQDLIILETVKRKVNIK